MALEASPSLLGRMIRAAQLDVTLYEEVEADEQAMGQAALVVLLAAVASGIGTGLSQMAHHGGGGLVAGVLSGVLGGLLGWVVWAYLTYFIGTQMLGGTATPGEMLRTLGFAEAPGVLSILVFVPLLGALVPVVVGIWQLIAGVVAIRQALDFSTGKAIVTVLIGWLVMVAVVFGVVFAIMLLIFGAAAMGAAVAR